jgi:hypothetical protein
MVLGLPQTISIICSRTRFYTRNYVAYLIICSHALKQTWNLTGNIRCYHPLSGTSGSNSLDHYSQVWPRRDPTLVQATRTMCMLSQCIWRSKLETLIYYLININFIDFTHFVVSKLRKFLNKNRFRIGFVCFLVGVRASCNSTILQ